MAQTTILSYSTDEPKKAPKLVRKDKDTSKGPFKCCYELTKKTSKKISYKGLEYNHDIWKCRVCDKEYLDTKQARKMENFWLVERILDEKLLSVNRKLNFDGNSFFFRFPKELSQNWSRESTVNIKLIKPYMFLVDVKESDKVIS